MTGTGKRLDRLYPALTARERALLILQAWKEEREEDPQIRWTMPPKQVREFNHYIFLMNAVNIELGTLLVYISSLIDQLSVRLGWLQTIELCSMVISGLGDFIALRTKEPVTESEYDKHVRQAREETVPASELAETLAERALEGTDAASEEGPQSKSTVREKEREIERLVDEGVLTGRRKGKRLMVNSGSFYDWLGEPVPVYPDWEGDYEVFPDAEVRKVHLLRAERIHAQEMLKYAPRNPHPEWSHLKGAADQDVTDVLLQVLRERIACRYRELRAAEIVIGEVAAEFEIDDPLVPPVRRTLETAKEDIEDVRSGLQHYVGDIELAEPDESDVARMRKIVEGAEKLYA